MSSPGPRYRYNARAARYIDARGRFLPATEVRSALDSAVGAAGRRMTVLAEDLRAGHISLAEWQLGMRDAIKQVHLYSAAAAKGGWAQMAPSDFGRVGQLVREQLAYLNRFAQQIEQGLPLDGRFLTRVTLYTEAGRGTYHEVELHEMILRGYTEERSVLNPADHCKGCIAEAARGYVQIGTGKKIGERDCGPRDKCHKEYR